jgi:hypothetical protein
MLVMIHGWSDTSRSFRHLGHTLVSEGVVDGVKQVRLGDYLSLDDDITFDDLADALEKAWRDEALPTRPRSVDVLIHSTGALVVRHWMTRYHKAAANPIRRFLMLAPANFGSPLAHKGRSFIGRVAKGFKLHKPLQTGTHILRGLELASPFSWDLAQRDVLSGEGWYGPGRVLATVLVGTSGYSGISAAANEPGTDGTVRVATANLNAASVSFDFVKDPQKPTLSFRNPDGISAFARIAGENHSTIALKERGPKSDATLPFIKGALGVTDATFEAFAVQLEQYSEGERQAAAEEKYRHGYQNTVVRLTDNHGAAVRDYFLELFGKTPDEAKPDDPLTGRIQEEVITTVHANEEDACYRSLHLDWTALQRILVEGNRALFISLTAMPDIRKTGSVGYSTVGYDDIGSIKLSAAKLRDFIRPDRTLLVDVVIRRFQEDRVLRFSPL